MYNVMVRPSFDLVVVTLTFKILSGLYSETVRCRTLILGREIGKRVYNMKV